MSVNVDVSADGIRVPVARFRVEELARMVLRAEKVSDATLSIAFLDARSMAELNRTHLARRGPTDVIAFGLGATHADAPVVGDVYICPEVARTNARAHGCGMREEIARLVVHGTLHVLGYDHPEGEERTDSDMWRRQEQLLRRWLVRAAA